MRTLAITVFLSLFISAGLAGADVSVNGLQVQIGDTLPPHSFAIINGDDAIQFSGNTKELRAVKRLKKTHQGDFIWYRQQDKQYLIDAADRIAQVKAHWTPLAGEEAKMDKLEDAMKPLEQQIDTLADAQENDSANSRRDDQRLRQRDKQMRTLARQMEAISEDMQEVSWQIEELSNAATQATIKTLDECIQNGQALLLP